LRQFRWFSLGPIPAAYDLRRLGWELLADTSSGRRQPHASLGRPHDLPLPDWLRLSGASRVQRKWTMLLEVEESAERAQMLRLGFGDALDPGTDLDELEARVLRLCLAAESLPRYRHSGPLKLDLLLREAFVADRALGLHPREFALLWRLLDTPGEAVGAEELLRDVWRLRFRPETNSLAVHVSRLRAKLRLAGIGRLVETLPDGSYRLAAEQDSPALPLAPDEKPLDGYLRIGKEWAVAQF